MPVGEYYSYNRGEELSQFVKITQIHVFDNGGTLTMCRNRKGYHFGFYEPITPYIRDQKEYGCSREEKIEYEIDDCILIKGKVKQHKANKFYVDENKNYIRWVRLEKCRVVQNLGKKT